VKVVPPESGTRIAKTICSMCHNSCGIDVTVKDGIVTSIIPMKEHPFRRLCVKTRGIPEWLYSEERVLSPLRRVGGTWRKVSWEEALGFIGDRLTDIKEKYGARALVVHLGTPLIATEVSRVASRFCSLYGTPNHTSSTSLCFAARGIGHGLLFSSRMSSLLPNYDSTRCVIVWGFNPGESNVNHAAEISSAINRGAKLVVIDPRTSPLSKKADIHARIKPGTDLALALGLLNLVVAERLYDESFVQDFTTGFDKLREHVRHYSPEVVEPLTWVPAETVRNIARAYAANRPAAVAQGVALDHSTTGVQTSRAISILIAITGNLDVRGGNVYVPPLKQASLRVKGRVQPDDAIGAGYPLFGRFTGETTAMPVPDSILNEDPYPVKALIVQASNPLLTWPDTSKVKQAFSKLDLLVVSDLFMTETAGLADVFLPATSSLERRTLKSYGPEGLPLVMMTDRVIEPLGNCLDDWRLWSELGKEVGYADYFPWQSDEELFAQLLEPSGITVAQLKQSPGGLLYAEPSQQQKYRIEGFGTSSGKAEIFSPTMERYGYDPLPAFTDTGSSANRHYPADDNSFILISGPRVSPFTHSRYRNIPSLRRLVPEPLVEINTDSAGRLGIDSGDEVVLTSRWGSIRLQARLTGDINPRVISIQHGWNEANANFLTGGASDPISGYPSFRSTPCRVVKAGVELYSSKP
jgi:anaerobic selenocysteine-containing dehydrogenase